MFNNHKNIILLLIVFAFFVNSNGQSLPGAEAVALSHSNTASAKNIFSLFTNPAGLSFIEKREIGIFYSPSPFGIAELSSGNFAYSEPTKIGNFSIGILHYGFDLYKENNFTFGYAKKFFNNVALGLTVSYNTVTIKNYGNSGTLNFSLGGNFKIHKNFDIGFSIINPLQNTEQDNLSPLYNIGLAYYPLEKASVNVAVAKDWNFPFSFRFGVEYPLIKFLFLRLGIQNEPNTFSGGIGIPYSIFKLNYAFTSHQILGLSHYIDIIISL